MEAEARPPTWKILLAFAMIYFVWGSTFLAIRVGVHEVPPFLLAAVRFFTAGRRHVRMAAAEGHAGSKPARVGRGFRARSAHLRARLRLLVLGRAARAFRNCGGGAGDHPGIHHADGNYLPAHAALTSPARTGPYRGHAAAWPC